MYSTIVGIVEQCLAANVRIDLKKATVKQGGDLLLEDGLVLPASACLFTQVLQPLSLIVDGNTYVLQAPLASGDELLVLKLGDKYLIIDRVGDLKNARVIAG